MDKDIYYKGNSKRGEEIIQILEKLGGINKNQYAGTDVTAIYFLDRNNIIQTTHSDTFIKEYFKEIVLPEKEIENYCFFGDKNYGRDLIEYLENLGFANIHQLSGCVLGELYCTEDNMIKSTVFASIKEQIIRSHKLIRFSDLKKESNLKKDSSFKPFDKVLVNLDGVWVCDFYSHHDPDDSEYFYTIASYVNTQIIHFEGNEHLVGKEVEKKYYKN